MVESCFNEESMEKLASSIAMELNKVKLHSKQMPCTLCIAHEFLTIVKLLNGTNIDTEFAIMIQINMGISTRTWHN
jgi:hypothetical protein